tara:strand:+ start:3157 stop:3372 length:216 start_codon:yes stop_codon:yes gene_type:complete
MTAAISRRKRAALALSALLLSANALYMLANPLSWYGTNDGVPDTGPFNRHFTRDIGVAYLTCALCAADEPA